MGFANLLGILAQNMHFSTIKSDVVVHVVKNQMKTCVFESDVCGLQDKVLNGTLLVDGLPWWKSVEVAPDVVL